MARRRLSSSRRSSSWACRTRRFTPGGSNSIIRNGGFAAIVSRAFASLADFTALSAHLLAPGGVWLAMKGARPEAEIAALPTGVSVEAVHRLNVPGVEGERHLVALRSTVG